VDAKVKKMLFLIGAIIGLLIIGSLLIFVFRDKTLSYNGIEEKMISATKKYLNDNEDMLPLSDNDEVIIDSNELSSNGYMKPISKYQKNKNVSCSGNVVVTKSGKYYNYSPYLNCGDDYTSVYLYEKLTKKIVSTGDGLYKMDQYLNGKNVPAFIYRGDYVDNYIELDGKLWRIVKIDGNNNIVLIQDYHDKNNGYRGVWDDRYNVQKDSNVGINNYSMSIIKREIDKYYKSEALSPELKAKLVNQDICIGSRSGNEQKKDGSVECKKTLDGEYLSLLSVYDFLNASLDKNCKKTIDKSCGNYNYLTDYGKVFWALTADKDTTYMAYRISDDASLAKLSSTATARIVININKNTLYAGGNGTYDDPYLIK